MFGDAGREQKIFQTEQRIREIAILLEGQNREINTSFEEWGISSKKIEDFLNTPTFFSTKNWDELQALQQEECEKLKRLGTPTIDPKATRETRQKSSSASPHWIPLQ